LGSFEGLVATPLRGLEYLFGKTLTYIGFGLVSTVAVVLVATLWFHVPFRSNLFTFLALATCYFLASLGVSQVVGSFIKNQQTAMLIMIMVFFVPSFFLAGLILPVDTSSLGARLAAYSLPVTHFILICRGVFLKGMSMTDLAGPALTLLAITGLTSTFSLLLFRKWIE
jgi:ABC-2 type transport system permease protein